MKDSCNDLLIHQIHHMLRAACELGALTAMVKAGKIKPYLKKSDAYRLYGRANVENWINQGLVKRRKDGEKSAAWRLERIELEILSKAILLTQII